MKFSSLIAAMLGLGAGIGPATEQPDISQLRRKMGWNPFSRGGKRKIVGLLRKKRIVPRRRVYSAFPAYKVYRTTRSR